MPLYLIAFKTKCWKGSGYNGPHIYTEHRVLLEAANEEEVRENFRKIYERHQYDEHFPYAACEITSIDVPTGNLGAIQWADEFFEA